MSSTTCSAPAPTKSTSAQGTASTSTSSGPPVHRRILTTASQESQLRERASSCWLPPHSSRAMDCAAAGDTTPCNSFQCRPRTSFGVAAIHENRSPRSLASRWMSIVFGVLSVCVGIPGVIACISGAYFLFGDLERTTLGNYGLLSDGRPNGASRMDTDGAPAWPTLLQGTGANRGKHCSTGTPLAPKARPHLPHFTLAACAQPSQSHLQPLAVPRARMQTHQPPASARKRTPSIPSCSQLAATGGNQARQRHRHH
jgi:hypothetical protein